MYSRQAGKMAPQLPDPAGLVQALHMERWRVLLYGFTSVGPAPSFSHFLRSRIMKNHDKSDEMKKSQHDANLDPITGTPGSHPVGTGVGAVTGGVIGGVGVGAAVGTVAGPVGTLVGGAAGAVVGGVAGGLAGKAVAEEIDPTVEHGYWRSVYETRPYAKKGTGYDQYAAAYQYGWESRVNAKDGTFEEHEPKLARGWSAHQGSSKLTWEHARPAAKDSWQRIGNRKPKPDKK